MLLECSDLSLGFSTSFSFHHITLYLQICPSLSLPWTFYLFWLFVLWLVVTFLPSVPQKQTYTSYSSLLIRQLNFWRTDLEFSALSFLRSLAEILQIVCVLFLYRFGVYVHSGTLRPSTSSTTTSQPITNSCI